jgi:hypothetical protein
MNIQELIRLFDLYIEKVLGGTDGNDEKIEVIKQFVSWVSEYTEGFGHDEEKGEEK